MAIEEHEVLKIYFPEALVIEEVESIVLRHGDRAIHVYPTEFSREAVERMVRAQNLLGSLLQQKGAQIKFNGRQMPIRINEIEEVAELPDCRVYTVSPYIDAPNLERSNLPTNQGPFGLQGIALHTLESRVDKAIVDAVGLVNIPNGYQLCSKNIHLGQDEIITVDIAAIAARFL